MQKNVTKVSERSCVSWRSLRNSSSTRTSSGTARRLLRVSIYHQIIVRGAMYLSSFSHHRFHRDFFCPLRSHTLIYCKFDICTFVIMKSRPEQFWSFLHSRMSEWCDTGWLPLEGLRSLELWARGYWSEYAPLSGGLEDFCSYIQQIVWITYALSFCCYATIVQYDCVDVGNIWYQMSTDSCINERHRPVSG